MHFILRGKLWFDSEVACTGQLYFCCALQETENHPVPWTSSSSSNNNMKTWTVCTDPVSIPHRHNRDLHHLNYQIHLIELISTTPTVSLEHFTICVCSLQSNTGLVTVVQNNYIGLRGHMNVSLHGCIGVSPHWLTDLFSPLKYFVCVFSPGGCRSKQKKKEKKSEKKRIRFCQS